MASQIFTFDAVIPANTPQSAPVTVQLTIPPRRVERIEAVVPAGFRGLVGFAFAMAGAPFLPANAGAWFVTDDEKLGWDVEDQPTSGAWQLLGYNTGVFSHVVHVRLLTQLADQAAPDVVTAQLASILGNVGAATPGQAAAELQAGGALLAALGSAQ
jgi:hypothetical protein